MKKFLPYIIGLVLVVLLGLLIVNAKKDTFRRMDQRITLKQKDKIPYGMSAAKTLLPSIFPDATVHYDMHSPGNWDFLSTSTGNQALVLVAKTFNASDEEMNRILYFAQQGNYVFIIAHDFSQEAINVFDFRTFQPNFGEFIGEEDSMKLKLEKPSYAADQLFVYPGKSYSNTFAAIDTERTVVLGRNDEGRPDFIAFKAGSGRIFIHSSPLAFSNYFILHKQNLQYYQNAFSAIPASVYRVVWNEYYLNKKGNNQNNEDNEPNIYRVLMRYKAFKWGLLLGFFMLILFGLLGSRRRQRKIPFYRKPQNDSLDFVKTLGRLYYDQGDHHNLARKMSVYFLDYVRTHYKLPTHTPDDNFVEALHKKSGYSLTELTSIVSFINYLGQGIQISENDLATFHKQLELFYQNT